MNKVKGNAKRILSFMLSLVIVMTGISYPEKAQAADYETVKIRSTADINKYLSPDKYMLGLLGV